jgi:hypothetical protein
MVVPPDSNFTVPDPLAGTAAVNDTVEPRFCGERGEAVSVVVVAESDGDVDAVLFAEGPIPPELQAATPNVYDVPPESPNSRHDGVETGIAAHVKPPGLDVTT